LVLAACSGGGGTDAGSNIAPAFTPTFSNVNKMVFQPVTGYGCTVSNCHSTGAGATVGDLDLADNPYQALLGDAGTGVPSVNVPSLSYNYNGMLLVKPGDPDNSLLFQKINAGAASTSGCTQAASGACEYGESMPNVAGELLPANVIEAVREWIANGAPNN
jgi:hypothetical protein